MKSLDSSYPPDFKTPEGWETLFQQCEREIYNIRRLHRKFGVTSTPHFDRVFDPFRQMQPSDIRVIIFGWKSCDYSPQTEVYDEGMVDRIKRFSTSFALHSPQFPYATKSYSNVCSALTNCGFGWDKSPPMNDFSQWLSQGVFLLNVCMTSFMSPVASYKYRTLSDEGTIWSSFVLKFLSYMNVLNPKIIIVFLGTEVSKLLGPKCKSNHVIHASNPKSFHFAKSNLFVDINSALKNDIKPKKKHAVCTVKTTPINWCLDGSRHKVQNNSLTFIDAWIINK